MPLTRIVRVTLKKLGATDMQIRRFAIAVCLMGAAYTASAGYTWSDYQPKSPPAERPALVTQGYSWSEFQPKAPPAERPALATRGYTWSDYQPKSPPTDTPAAAVHGYHWSE
jgi:hypothetical protein